MNYTEEFERFWKAYPRRYQRDSSLYVKRKKAPAFIKWQKLSQEIHNECLAKVKYIYNSEGGSSSVRDAVTWLNQLGWEEIELPNQPKPKAFPAEITPKFKSVESHIVSVNNERNRQMKSLYPKK